MRNVADARIGLMRGTYDVRAFQAAGGALPHECLTAQTMLSVHSIAYSMTLVAWAAISFPGPSILSAQFEPQLKQWPCPRATGAAC